MNFVAIDFETANERRNSACSIGLAIVKNSEIVDVKYWLIKPHEMRFLPMNVWIHGIVEEDVENERYMDELWDEIRPYLEENFVIAHNASFDISVLRNTLDVYNIPYPKFDYACTMLISKNYYKDLENYKLNTIAKHIGVQFKHHHAGEDAAAAAKILIKICKELNINTVEKLSDKLDLKIGKLYDGGYSSASSLKSNSRKNREVDSNIKKTNSNTSKLEISKNHPFLNKTIVFTGPLDEMSRIEAMQKVINIGGFVGSSVTKRTNYLVVGVRNFEKLSSEKKSIKLRKAEMLIEKGQEINILSEEQFFDMMYNL